MKISFDWIFEIYWSNMSFACFFVAIILVFFKLIFRYVEQYLVDISDILSTI